MLKLLGIERNLGFLTLKVTLRIMYCMLKPKYRPNKNAKIHKTMIIKTNKTAIVIPAFSASVNSLLELGTIRSISDQKQTQY